MVIMAMSAASRQKCRCYVVIGQELNLRRGGSCSFFISWLQKDMITKEVPGCNQFDGISIILLAAGNSFNLA